jgi:hypothetical protein
LLHVSALAEAGKLDKTKEVQVMKKKGGNNSIPPEDAVRKEDLNRIRGTVEFIDPERGPTHKGKKADDRRNSK